MNLFPLFIKRSISKWELGAGERLNGRVFGPPSHSLSRTGIYPIFLDLLFSFKNLCTYENQKRGSRPSVSGSFHYAMLCCARSLDFFFLGDDMRPALPTQNADIIVDKFELL